MMQSTRVFVWTPHSTCGVIECAHYEHYTTNLRKRDLIERQKRPNKASKETSYSVNFSTCAHGAHRTAHTSPHIPPAQPTENAERQLQRTKSSCRRRQQQRQPLEPWQTRYYQRWLGRARSGCHWSRQQELIICMYVCMYVCMYTDIINIFLLYFSAGQ